MSETTQTTTRRPGRPRKYDADSIPCSIRIPKSIVDKIDTMPFSSRQDAIVHLLARALAQGMMEHEE
jgi:hypothetical protein